MNSLRKNVVSELIYNQAIKYPAPSNLSYAAGIWAFLITDADKLAQNIFLAGLAIAGYIFILFSPKLINLLRQEDYKFITKSQVLLLLLIQILPHLIAALIVHLLGAQLLMTIPARFLLILLTQLIIVIPTFNQLSKLGNWAPILVVQNPLVIKWCWHSCSNAWGSPILFLHLSKGILYPFIFVGYLLSIRYFLLGQIIDMNFLFNLPPEILPIIIYLLCFYPCYYLLLIRYLVWRSSLWEHWCIFLDAINLSVIQIDWIFNVMKRVYFFSKLIYYFTYYREDDHQNENLRVKKCSEIFERFLDNYSGKIAFVSLLVPIFEIMLTRNLYYSNYYLFIFAITRSLWFFLSNFPLIFWENSLDLSDYLHHNYKHPHRPRWFWMLRFDGREASSLGIAWQYSEEMKLTLQQMKRQHLLRYSNEAKLQSQTFGPINKPRMHIPYSYTRTGHRLRFVKGSFLRHYALDCTIATGLRFNQQFKRHTHTTSALKSTMTLFQRIKTGLHLNTGFLTPNALCQILLVQENYLHVPTCRNISARVPAYDLNIFKHAELLKICNNGNRYVTSFIEFQENSMAAQLMAQMRKNATIYAITPYKEFFAPHVRCRLQPNPDLAFHSRTVMKPYPNPKSTPSSHILNEGGGTLLTYDQKSHAIRNYGPSPNQIICVDDIIEYLEILKKTAEFYNQRKISTVALNKYFLVIEQTGPTAEEAFNIYIDFLPQFMDLPYQPPIWITSHFNINALSETARKFVVPSENLNFQLSDLIEKYNIPNSTSYHPDLEKVKDSTEYPKLLKEYHNALAAIQFEEAEKLSGAELDNLKLLALDLLP